MTNYITDNNSENLNYIAIIGMSCRFPNANNLEEFWKNLQEEHDVIHRFSDQELIEAGVNQDLLKNRRYVKARGILENVEFFDADFFNITPHEASITDPQHRIFLELCWEALETAGYAKNHQSELIGIFAGMSDSTYLKNNLLKNEEFLKNNTPFQTSIATSGHFLATKVSYHLNLKGPSLNIQTACSTSLVAVVKACQSLLANECDIALAGGITIRLPQVEGYLYQDGHIYSVDGKCRPFDKKASGTIGSNGSGVVVLKRLNDALRDRDDISAIIRGFSLNNDGSLKTGYTAPSVQEQSRCVATALSTTDPETISYVETHGTGTILGDPIEIAALIKAFRYYTAKKNFCAIGSVKSNMGHTDTASGVAGFIKTVLSLKNKIIPASLYFEEANPHINFSESPFYVNRHTCSWKNNHAVRRAGVSSFGIGGTNSHVILEEAPLQKIHASTRPIHIFLLSAKTFQALEKQKTNLLNYLVQKKDTNIDIADIAYTLQIGRKEFPYRQAFLASNFQQLIDQLNGTEFLNFCKNSHLENKKSTIAFLLAPLDHFYKGIAQDIYQKENRFKNYINECISFLKKPLKSHVINFLLESSYIASDNVNADMINWLAYFIFEYSLTKTFIDYGINPEAIVSNNDIGKYVALCLEKSITLADAINTICNPNNSTTFLHIKNLDSSAKCIEMLQKKGYKTYLAIGAIENIFCNPITLIRMMPTKEEKKLSPEKKFFIEEALAECWLNGISINWRNFYNDELRYKINLPSYPFERKKYWIEPSKKDIHRLISKNTASLYLPYWEISNFPPMVDLEKNDTWLIFSDQSEFSKNIITDLIAKNQKIISVTRGDTFQKIENYYFTINPKTKDDYHKLYESLHKSNITPTRIIHCWSLTNDAKQSSHHLSKNIHTHGFLSLILISQEFFQNNKNLSFTIVTNYTTKVTSKDIIDSEKSSLIAACLTIPQEYPGISCQIVDADENFLKNSSDGTRVIINESYFLSKTNDYLIAYRKDNRFTKGFKPLLNSMNIKKSHFKKNGTYLITGGLGKIGTKIAEYLATHYNANLMLLSHTTVSEKLKHKILNLCQGASSVEFIHADVSDYQQMEAVFSRIKKPIDGILHLAASLDSAAKTLIKNITDTQYQKQLLPKLQGAKVLEELLKKFPVSFCVLFSSLSSIMGGIGLASYAASNCGLDAMAMQHHSETHTLWLSINWDAISNEEKKNNYLSLSGVPELLDKCLQYLGFYPEIAISLNDLNHRIFSSIKKSSDQINIQSNSISNKDNIIDKLIEIFSICLGVDKIKPEDKFYDIGGDSVSAIKLLNMIEKEFSVNSQLADVINNNIISLAELLSDYSSTNSSGSLIKLKEGKDKPSIFLIHPASGFTFCYVELAKYLPENCSCYALQDPSFESGAMTFNTIEEMAANYLLQIKKIQPTGPYLLSGFSYGGNVVFEIARLLETNGDNIQNIIIIDSWAASSKELKDFNTFKKSMKETLNQIKEGYIESSYDQKLLMELAWKRIKLLFEYHPQNINAQIILCKAKEILPEYQAIDEAANHWSKHSTKPIKIHLIEGNHDTILKDQGVKQIAQVFNDVIREFFYEKSI